MEAMCKRSDEAGVMGGSGWVRKRASALGRGRVTTKKKKGRDCPKDETADVCEEKGTNLGLKLPSSLPFLYSPFPPPPAPRQAVA